MLKEPIPPVSQIGYLMANQRSTPNAIMKRPIKNMLDLIGQKQLH
jgi:hypothetical protein